MAKDDPRDKQKKKEAAIVDRLLRQLPHADPTLGASGPRPKRPPPPKTRQPLKTGRPRRQSTPLGVWGRLLVPLLLSVAITQWPYRHDCGLASVPYLFVAGMIVVTALWAAAGAWRLRLPVAHVLSLAMLLWGLVVAAHHTLPRVGYAKAEASWACATPEPTIPAAVPAVSDSAAPDSAMGSAPLGGDSAPRP